MSDGTAKGLQQLAIRALIRLPQIAATLRFISKE